VKLHPKQIKLTKAEARAVRVAIKVYCGLRRSGYPKFYLLGVVHGIQSVAQSLPHGRHLEKMSRWEKKFSRIMDRLENKK
jgi:hypothetical protein